MLPRAGLAQRGLATSSAAIDRIGKIAMSTYEDRLAALREQLKADRLDGFVVPLTDEHMSEYVGSYAQRLAWLTGFQGSAGSAVVLPEEAAIFVDGRYTLAGPRPGRRRALELPVGARDQHRRLAQGARARRRRGSATIPGCTPGTG